MSMTDVLGQLDPSLRKRLMAGSEVEIHKQQTPSIGLTSALNGGFAFGRQILIWGNKSAGKSSFCLQMIGDAQRDGKVCAWLDSEQSFDPEWAKKLGADPETLIYSPATSINEMVDTATSLMMAGVDIIVVDSISALLPAIYFEKKTDELKQLEDTKQIGAEARDMTNAVKMLNYANNRVKPVLLIFISQQRNKLGSMFVSHQPTGGFAVQFFSSTVVKLWSSESDNKAIMEKIQIGDRLIERNVGRTVSWDVNFNKTGPAFVNGEYDFYFAGDKIGIDSVAELFDIALERGLIEKSGNAWFIIDGEKINGRPKGIEYLRNNPEKVNELVAAIG